MAMDRFIPPNERQAQLCRECRIDPAGMAVISETEGVLRLRHYKSGNNVLIDKSEAQKRKEKEMKLW